MFQGLQNGAIRGLQIEADFRDYKSCQEGLESVAAYGISNRGKKISKQCRDFRQGQRDFKSWQGKLQTRAGISNWGRDYKSVQNHLLIKMRQNWFFFIIPPKQNYSVIGSSGKRRRTRKERDNCCFIGEGFSLEHLRQRLVFCPSVYGIAYIFKLTKVLFVL